MMEALRAFVLDRGSLGSDVPIEEAWWAQAAQTRPSVVEPRYGFGLGYGSSRANSIMFALESILEGPLYLSDWKALGHGEVMQLYLVPFMFNVDGLFWTEIRSARGEAMLIGNVAPTLFMKHWDGSKRGAIARAYRTRAEASFQELIVRDGDPGTGDEAAAKAVLAVEYSLHGLFWQAWEQRLPVQISW